MSDYKKPTKHPKTGKFEIADWMDNHFGHYNYGVKFPDGQIFNPDEVELETMDWDKFDPEISIRLRKSTLMELNHKLAYKENPLWVTIRSAIREQAPFCLVCGHDKTSVE